MEQQLHDHIILLEDQIQTISDRLTSPRLTGFERGRCEADLRIAETALAHFRAAYDFEQRNTSPVIRTTLTWCNDRDYHRLR